MYVSFSINFYSKYFKFIDTKKIVTLIVQLSFITKENMEVIYQK
jgi:hypothetical protein